MQINYKPSPTAKLYHQDSSFVRAIIGCIGSGKSVASVVELLIKAHAQQPDAQGIRKTKWCIIRNTYRELIDTTLQTFHEWIPQSAGTWSAVNMIFTLNHKLSDGTRLHAQFLFRAMDRPQDVKKLLSLELTGGFVNEAKEVPKSIIEMLQGRCGRYPKTVGHYEGDNYIVDYGPTWHGIIMDTNPPDVDHWFYKLFEETKPANHAIFHQPSGLADNAENIHNLPKNYYNNMIAGKDQEWINVYVHGTYGFISDGNPVFPEYHDDVHSSVEGYVLNPALPIYIGIDFGLTPAAVFGQITASGAMHLFDELCTFDMGAVSFGRLLREKMNSKAYAGCTFEVYGDPAGVQRAQTDEFTPFMILQNQGIDAFPAYTNDPLIRREVIADYLLRLDFVGKPAFVVHNSCKMLRKAFSGGYKYKRMQVSGEDKYKDVPDKNKYSHCSDACQYLFLGAVGGERVIGGYKSDNINYDNRGIV